MRFIRLKNVNFAVLNETFGYEDGDENAAGHDVILCGFSAFKEVNLQDEIDGASDCISTVAAISKQYANVAVSGLKTHINGIKHLSAAVACKGRLLDIVDRTNNLRGDEYLPSNKIKIYRTEKTRAALLLDTDVLLARNWARVAESCDMVMSLALNMTADEASLVSTLSQLYGLPYILAAENGLWWGEPIIDG